MRIKKKKSDIQYQYNVTFLLDLIKNALYSFTFSIQVVESSALKLYALWNPRILHIGRFANPGCPLISDPLSHIGIYR
jgi:hypothetical protein